MSNDIFISYRRKGTGFGVAGELQTRLEDRRYHVFLDVDEIGSGNFPEQIERAIANCNDFLVVLSPGFFDRCSDEGDWVRQELLLAIQYNKNIIGVSLPGFVMPEPSELPEPLRCILSKQVFIWSHEYRQASLDKIEENMLSYGLKKKRNRRRVLGVAAIMAVAAIGVWLLVSDHSVSEQERPQVAAVDQSKPIRDEFLAHVAKADSLLELVPKPTSKDDFTVFMQALGEYEEAVHIGNANPEVPLDILGVQKTLDSLGVLRAERLKIELTAAEKFMNVNQYDFARYRYENAEVIAVEGDEAALEAVRNRIR